MNDKEALYQACCDNPYEDTPRLVYADCLEEQGDTIQAEYIRESIALEHLTIDEENLSEIMRQKERFERTQLILNENWELWILQDQRVAKHFDFTDHKISYARGMPDTLTCAREQLAGTREKFNTGLDVDVCAWMVEGLPLTKIHPKIAPRNLYQTDRNKIIESQWRKGRGNPSDYGIFMMLMGRLPTWLFNVTLDERLTQFEEGKIIEMDRLTIVDNSGDVMAIRFQTPEEATECMNTALCNHLSKLVKG